MANQILIVTGDGGESYEAWYAYHRFLEAGDKPTVAAPSKRRLHLVMHDFEEGWDTYVERQGYGMEAQVSIDEVKESDFDAILILGGRAPEYLRHHTKLLNLVQEFHQRGKWVWAICHGIQVLINAGLAAGNCLTCYEHVRSEVERNGGTYSTLEAVRDKNIVTAQTWQSHPEFYREIFNCLAEKK
jgi:protease I